MDRGELLFEYRVPKAHPILYAGLVVFAFVAVTGSIENLLRDSTPLLYAVYLLPLVATGYVMAMLWPSDVKIYRNGIAPSRPLILRTVRPYVTWSELAAIYPSFYDVTGAFVSPFASSDGKVTQMGLGLEWPNGRTETVRFTPTRFVMGRSRSAGYKQALDVVRDIFAEQGRPLTPAAPQYDEASRQAMLAQAHAPFLPFFAIVFLFASAAPVLLGLTRLDVPVAVALPLALLAPLGVSLRSYAKSRERHRLLNALSKAAEFERHTIRGLRDLRDASTRGAL